MISILRTGNKIGIAIALLGLLGACANMADIPPGASLSQVEAQFGRANYSCPLPNGGQRLIWTTQPTGQRAWGTNVDSSGNTDRVVSILTDAHFNVLKTGTWTPEQVKCEFGPPAETGVVGLPSSRQIVWSYRYLQSDAWNSLMYVYFGQDGSHVTHFHPGPDPMFEPREMEGFSF